MSALLVDFVVPVDEAGPKIPDVVGNDGLLAEEVNQENNVIRKKYVEAEYKSDAGVDMPV